ncbi:hypothetical protein ACFFNX_10810 [Actinoallomurus acaciae]|uniref:Barstar (barnase inhibitor) domain-containing protein n=2 Tax=Actinoallomurus acaciae TaxID=502577 RepID=A0ABV5YCC0_9ACTN
MDYRELFRQAFRRPMMFGLDGSFAGATAFVNGCDAGNAWRLLDGFSEWLAVGLGHGQNLSWQALILRHALPDGPWGSPIAKLDNRRNGLAVNALFDLLNEFLEFRDENGLAVIFARYFEMFDIGHR